MRVSRNLVLGRFSYETVLKAPPDASKRDRFSLKNAARDLAAAARELEIARRACRAKAACISTPPRAIAVCVRQSILPAGRLSGRLFIFQRSLLWPFQKSSSDTKLEARHSRLRYLQKGRTHPKLMADTYRLFGDSFGRQILPEHPE